MDSILTRGKRRKSIPVRDGNILGMFRNNWMSPEYAMDETLGNEAKRSLNWVLKSLEGNPSGYPDLATETWHREFLSHGED